MRLRTTLPALVLAAAALWPTAARPQDAPEAADEQFTRYRGQFHGVWRATVPRERIREIVDRAIERAVGAMNYFMRGIARGQLRDNTPLNQRIDLVFLDGRRITVRFDNRHAYTTRLGRTTRFRTPEGDDMRVVQRFRPDGRLEQVFQTDEGTRWNVYQSTGDGQMRVEATTQGMMMPQPLYFTLDYRREP